MMRTITEAEACAHFDCYMDLVCVEGHSYTITYDGDAHPAVLLPFAEYERLCLLDAKENAL